MTITDFNCRTSSHLVLEGVCAGGWAPDYLDKMLAPLDNLISRDPERFLTGVSSIEGKSYKQLLLEIVKKCVVTVTDPEIPKYALELMMLLFEGYVGKSPAVDDMMAPCFQVLIEYMQVSISGSIIVFNECISDSRRFESVLLCFSGA